MLPLQESEGDEEWQKTYKKEKLERATRIELATPTLAMLNLVMKCI